MKQIQSAAKSNSISVSLGFSENDNNSVYIAQVLIGPDGQIVSHRRKMKPTHMERTIFGDASGECFSSVAELPFGRVGALSCWEHIQPLIKYHTIAQREDIHVSAWPSLKPHSGGPELWSMSAEEADSNTYAIESTSFVLHCTALITEAGAEKMKTAGGMGIIASDLDLDQIIAAKLFADVAGDYSRPDLMSLNVCTRVKKMMCEDEKVSETEVIHDPKNSK
ncbi:hypothetical protein N7488_005325 [Penicillium malachiteum]|nr:hypothetical protein N7488_005325 [Penicillium malachiteum]